LLGIVFHLGWCFVPRGAGTPITDVSSNIGFDYFFYTAHMFRMQVFFLIAGFFGRMLYHRRGPLGFVKNRCTRIAIPLVLFWLVLAPLLIFTWVWGANRSGQNLTEVPLSLISQLMQMGLILIPRSMGGLFTLAHLWFLYYLLGLYVVVLLLRVLMLWLVPRKLEGQRRADAIIASAVQSPWSLIWLAVLSGLILFTMDGWLGVDTPSRSYQPSIPVLLLYGVFFCFGWLLHRQTGLLSQFIPHWRWQLGLGVALSVVLFAGFQQLYGIGIGSAAGQYPQISPNQITAWPKFHEHLVSAQTDAEATPELVILWQKISAGDRNRMEQLADPPPIDLQIGVCKTLNKLLVHADLFEPVELDAEGNPVPIQPGLLDPEVAARASLENRQRLDELFAGLLLPDPAAAAWYRPVKFAYSLGYALAMWCFVFATLGYFQEKWAHHSRAWRYVADSSYWVYLAHLPLVIWMHVWIARLPWPGLIKFLLLNVAAFAALYASYHYLVRSTPIGRMLNGRRYPFVLLPWTSTRKVDQQTKPEEEPRTDDRVTTM
jgi:peptidoglycan/LPS O-acetylase OafA/YrhL